MTVLGAILAGGQSRRFGSNKALALMPDGRPMIAHVAAHLARACQSVVLCGGAWADFPILPDRPRAGLGPLGGLCAALFHAAQHGHAAVLCAPCDMPQLPDELLSALSPGPTVVDGQWLLGLWPMDLAASLHDMLLREGAMAMRHWVVRSGARTVALGPLRNINTRHDLEAGGGKGASD